MITQVTIITRNRPELLARLLQDIDACGPPGLRLAIYDDASDADYRDVLDRHRTVATTYTRFPEHHGRKLHWRIWQAILDDLKSGDADRLAFFPDDIRLCRDFFSRAYSLWDAIRDEKKITLNVLRDVRANGAGWTGVVPTVMPTELGDVLYTGWEDGLFVCDRRFLTALEHQVPPIPPNWWDKHASTGVHMSISQKLHKDGHHMYCVARSLVAHVSEASEMHPEVRRENPLQAEQFVDGDQRFAGDPA